MWVLLQSVLMEKILEKRQVEERLGESGRVSSRNRTGWRLMKRARDALIASVLSAYLLSALILIFLIVTIRDLTIYRKVGTSSPLGD